MYGTMHFQSSRPGYGDDAADTTAAATDPKKKERQKYQLTETNVSDLISAFTDITKTGITTVGGIDQTRLTGKAPSTSRLSSGGGGGQGVSGGGGSGGGTGIPGWAIGLGAVAAVGLVVVGVKFAMKK